MTDSRSLTLLDPGQLAEVRDAMADSIREGLREDGRSIRALPAHLPPPPEDLEGDALVVDTGGTNMRAAVIRLSRTEAPTILAGPIQAPLPVRDAASGPLDGTQFFDLQADLARRLGHAGGLPVGYCFSYPSQVLPNRDARLLRWTKGVDISGVEGELVGTRLREALDRAGLRPGPVRVLNDTVASLLAGARAFNGRPRDVIGLIAGTGTNMAGFYDARNAPKLADVVAPMAVNYESGNFTPPHLSDADHAADAASESPGQQRFEKAVSGFYLPFLFTHLHPEADYDPYTGTGPLVHLADHGPDSAVRQTAKVLLTRSADLVAAGLAGAIRTYPGDAKRIGVLAEGSLFWRATGYAEHVQSNLRTLLPEDQSVHIIAPNEANLVGAACAALVE